MPGIFAYHNQKDPSRRNLERLSQSTLLTLTTTWKQYSRQLYLLESSFECITMILSNEYPLPGDASCFLKQRTLCFEVSTMVQHECECVWVVRGIDAAWNFYKHISSNGLVHLQSEQPAVDDDDDDDDDNDDNDDNDDDDDDDSDGDDDVDDDDGDDDDDDAADGDDDADEEDDDDDDDEDDDDGDDDGDDDDDDHDNDDDDDDGDSNADEQGKMRRRRGKRG